jgi:hypothetical protein
VVLGDVVRRDAKPLGAAQQFLAIGIGDDGGAGGLAGIAPRSAVGDGVQTESLGSFRSLLPGSLLCFGFGRLASLLRQIGL